MSDTPTPAPAAPPPKKRRPPVLLNGQIVTEITVKAAVDDAGDSLFDDIVLRIRPFSRVEEEAYHAAVEKAVKAAPDDQKRIAQNAVRLEWFAPRIVGWNMKLLPADDAPDAEINLGTVAMLPLPAWPVIESGMCGEIGRLVGN